MLNCALVYKRFYFFLRTIVQIEGGALGLMVSAVASRLSGPDSSPGRGYEYVVFLGKNSPNEFTAGGNPAMG